MNMRLTVATVAVSLLLVGAGVAGELAEPVPIEAAGQPIDMEHGGHAAPFVVDFDGDGNKDLLTGERFDGRLRIYRNLGTNAEPKFDRYEWFKAGANLGRIPSG
ncbi:MAG: hypothetical protein ACYSWU_29605 [Planctomycetota bacterium]|jgi:hypothetical protein